MTRVFQGRPQGGVRRGTVVVLSHGAETTMRRRRAMWPEATAAVAPGGVRAAAWPGSPAAVTVSFLMLLCLRAGPRQGFPGAERRLGHLRGLEALRMFSVHVSQPLCAAGTIAGSVWERRARQFGHDRP